MWVSGDAHLQNSLDTIGYNSLAEPMADFDREGIDYDLAINLGDFDSAQKPPTLEDNTREGEAVAEALNSSRRNPRSKTYCLNGNHDAGDGQMDWFERWVDPLGQNTRESGNSERGRPYPVTYIDRDQWHSYYIETPQATIFMLSDRNELKGPAGRGGLVHGNGGYPSGAITLDTWEWFQAYVLANTQKPIIVCSHQGVRNTVIGTADNDGVDGGFHGRSGYPKGSGSIYSLVDERKPSRSLHGTDIIKDFFTRHPEHSVKLWLNGHTHVRVGETFRGRGEMYREAGVTYLNACSLTKTWVNPSHGRVDSRSWLVDMYDESITANCYVHNPEHTSRKGFNRTIHLPI
ncbi:metallophosphoesterase [Calycomorphotria hydatis]|uniref:Calcineurin-like phosphoesterase domain-containing protein n=1 Tax=Calycomorphotria hydatis TaxID=2528027 RepID=A0A517TBZ9_9PLAN|nr:metallophosphoesterase [Calycomorphotria hydatis]QDT65902.1 hypothetical protein V22_31650 [Calycomorphotria hydatis]